MDNLISIAGSVFYLPIFVFLAWLIREASKPTERAAEARKPDSSNGISARRRAESKPNVICGFPDQQAGRAEAPLF